MSGVLLSLQSKVANRIFLSCLLLSVTGFNISCSSGGGGGGNGGGIGPTPKSKEEALAKLSSHHRTNLEDWKKKVIKSCQAAEIFAKASSTGGDLSGTGIDERVLAEMSHGSAAFVGSDQSLAILGYPTSLSGIGQSHYDETVSINGDTQELKSETKSNGSTCEVFIYGVKIDEIQIRKSWDVIATWQPQKEISPIEGSLNSATSKVPEKAWLKSSAFVDLASEFLRPTAEGREVLGKALGVNSDQLQKYFVLSTSAPSVAVTVQNGILTTKNSPEFLVDSLLVQGWISNAKGKTFVEWGINPENTTSALLKNSSRKGWFSFRGQPKFAKNETGTWIFEMSQALPSGFNKTLDNETLACLNNRLGAYYADPVLTSTILTPSAQELAGPCNVLQDNVMEWAFQRGYWQSIMGRSLRRVAQTPNTRYNGWDELLKRWVFEQGKSSENLSQAINPTGDSGLLMNVAILADAAKHAINKFKIDGAFQREIYDLASLWPLRGEGADVSYLELVVRAVANAADPFAPAVGTLLAKVSLNPQTAESDVQFLMNLSEEYKSSARKLRNSALVLGIGGEVDAYFGKLLALKPALSHFSEKQARVDAIQGLAKEFSGSQKGPIQSELNRLAWVQLENNQATVDQLKPLYRVVELLGVPFQKSVQQLITAVSADGTSAHQAEIQYGLNLDLPTADAVLGLSPLATDAEIGDWGKGVADTILQSRPTKAQILSWSALLKEAIEFNKREAARLAGDWAGWNDDYRKKLIRRAVDQSWRPGTFKELEAIAELIKLQSFCQSKKGASSLADCAGLDLFSASTNKFFDPRYGDRYGRIAPVFVKWFKKLESVSGAYSLKSLLQSEFFKPVWKNCSEPEVSTRTTRVDGNLGAYISADQFSKKVELEKAIQSDLEDCPAHN